MALPTFNSFSLQDDTYITENVQHHTRAKRKIQTSELPRRIGKKFLNQQLQEKVIEVSGKIIASTASGLKDAIDDLFQYVSGKEGSLVVDSDRTYTCTAEEVVVTDRNFTQTMSPFRITFISAKPYSEGVEHSAGFVVPSGTYSYTITPTISGNMLNRPYFSFTMPSGTGVSPVNSLKILHQETGNEVTFSGITNAEGAVIFDYDSYKVTVDANEQDYLGQFADIDAGSNTFVVTVSGSSQSGTRASLNYNPRYW